MKTFFILYIGIAAATMLAGIVMTLRAAVKRSENGTNDDSWEGMTVAGIVCSIIIGLVWMIVPVFLLTDWAAEDC